LRFRSRSSQATRVAARRLGAAIEASAETRSMALVIGLVGPLGAGKTDWVKGLAEGLGIAANLVASPTFVIASEYPGSRPLAHVDFYRLETEGELEAAGFVDLLDPGRVVAIEWADRFPDALPDDRVEVRIARGSEEPETQREIEAVARGPIARRVLERFERAMNDPEEAASWP
jgi:tRNA threonylcarbamoyladenosine biosynthesis protein TsaE